MRKVPQNFSIETVLGTLLVKAGLLLCGPQRPKSKKDGLALLGMAVFLGTPVA
jgi:hypothetical protein